MAPHAPQAARLRHSIDVCIEFVQTGLQVLDLLTGDLSENLVSGCPDNQCLVSGTIFTFQGPGSYLEFTVDNISHPRQSHVNIQLQFQTMHAGWL